jgi:hypothetical protein
VYPAEKLYQELATLQQDIYYLEHKRIAKLGSGATQSSTPLIFKI